MDERRRFVRTPIETEIWLGQDGIFTRSPARLRDLSEGGAFIETRQRFAVGAILSLGFNLPSMSQRISCSVSVRSLRDDAGLGVEFLDMAPEDRQRVRAFIQDSTIKVFG
jgi:c-di-GMP-binding flagellar brake protein YcgR